MQGCISCAELLGSLWPDQGQTCTPKVGLAIGRLLEDQETQRRGAQRHLGRRKCQHSPLASLVRIKGATVWHYSYGTARPGCTAGGERFHSLCNHPVGNGGCALTVLKRVQQRSTAPGPS